MADLTEKQAAAKLQTIHENHAYFNPTLSGNFAVVPDGFSITSLEKYQTAPNRMTGKKVFRDIDSLAKYLERFEKPNSVAFSCPHERLIRTEIDHHDGKDGVAGFCEHHANFSAIFTAEYQAWRSFCGTWVSQKDAGEFLEERAVDVIEPDAASIMDMVMSFDALKKVTFKQSTRLHDGQRQFTYNEENEVRGNVTLPERLKIRLPIFDRQEPDQFRVNVRFDIQDGKLRFQFRIHNQQALEDIAFERCEDALRVARPELLILRVV